MKKVIKIIAIIVSLCTTPILLAQDHAGNGYTGPQLISTSSLIEDGIDNDLVSEQNLIKLQGTICPSEDGMSYYLEDSNGRVLLEIDSDDWPYKPMNEETVFIVYGNLKKSSSEGFEIDVKQMFVLK